MPGVLAVAVVVYRSPVGRLLVLVAIVHTERLVVPSVVVRVVVVLLVDHVGLAEFVAGVASVVVLVVRGVLVVVLVVRDAALATDLLTDRLLVVVVFVVVVESHAVVVVVAVAAVAGCCRQR